MMNKGTQQCAFKKKNVKIIKKVQKQIKLKIK